MSFISFKTMVDPWDFDSRHPARAKSAEFGTKRFICQLKDCDDESLTFLGSVDYRIDEFGVTIENLEYFPHYPKMREAITEWVSMNLF